MPHIHEDSTDTTKKHDIDANAPRLFVPSYPPNAMLIPSGGPARAVRRKCGHVTNAAPAVSSYVCKVFMAAWFGH